ncbi:hypothetical protein, partial [Anaerostipes hadrus]|uniref:hypothetical protein n=1 Tax=Anaerostipes hadrus TaxID=649756 RepID=UPI001ADD96AD
VRSAVKKTGRMYMVDRLQLMHLELTEDHPLTQQTVVHHMHHLVHEAAISRKVTGQQAAAIRLIVQALQLREVQ